MDNRATPRHSHRHQAFAASALTTTLTSRFAHDTRDTVSDSFCKLRRLISALTPTLSASTHFMAPSAGETTNAVNRMPPSDAPARTTWIVWTTGSSATTLRITIIVTV